MPGYVAAEEATCNVVQYQKNKQGTDGVVKISSEAEVVKPTNGGILAELPCPVET